MISIMEKGNSRQPKPPPPVKPEKNKTYFPSRRFFAVKLAVGTPAHSLVLIKNGWVQYGYMEVLGDVQHLMYHRLWMECTIPASVEIKSCSVALTSERLLVDMRKGALGFLS